VAPTSNLRALLRRATVVVAPRRFGVETQRGLLEAMAVGVPVITTPEGLDGLPLQHGREIYVEGSPTGFSERLIELLHKPTLREAMGAKGRAFIRLHYSSAAAATRLSQVVAAVVNGGSRNGNATHGPDVGVAG